MKNLVRFTTFDETLAFLKSNFKTDLFKKYADRHAHPVCDLLIKAAHRPLIVYDYEDYRLEGSHFTTWMGAIQRRHYDNPYIHDLYWLHEIHHFATMTYDPDVSFARWHKKMSENEYHSALFSEAWVYFVMPELREHTFDFEIWVDRFIEEERRDEYTVDSYESRSYADHEKAVKCLHVLDNVRLAYELDEPLYYNSAGLAYQALYQERKYVMRMPNPDDFIEMQISIFAKQNLEWSLTWQNNWRKVEAQMADMLERHAKGEDTSDHIAWLEEMAKGSIEEVGAMIPFYDEAEVFADVLADIHARGGNQILKR